MSAPDVSDAEKVDFVLQTSGLPVTADEREWLVRNYALLARAAERVRIPDVRYGEPALIYPANLPEAQGI